MQKTVSLKDVAKKAGVGIGTASRVLNEHPSVREETREKVLKAMKELNYQINDIARSLKMKQTKTIGIMIPDISSSFYSEIVRGAEDVAKIYEYSIFLMNTDLDREKEMDVLNILNQKKVDGIIFMSNTVDVGIVDIFKDMGIPIILIASQDPTGTFYNVNIDNEKAAYDMVSYLCKNGHEEICMLAGEFDDPDSGIPRIEGYKRALKENNIEVCEDNIFEGDYKYLSGYENMKRILQRDRMPTAIFAASDFMAIGAAKAVMERGYRVPEDISIVGFDGVEVAEFFYPSITTVEQPRYEMGAVGMRLLLKAIGGEELEDNMVLKHKLLMRESCKKIIKA